MIKENSFHYSALNLILTSSVGTGKIEAVKFSGFNFKGKFLFIILNLFPIKFNAIL